MSLSKVSRKRQVQSSRVLTASNGLDMQLKGCADGSLSVDRLSAEPRCQLLSFLARRAVHTVYMAGLIRDNGVVSPLNRGSFYACRNAHGVLEGVALIGHATLVEARSAAALGSFARF